MRTILNSSFAITKQATHVTERASLVTEQANRVTERATLITEQANDATEIAILITEQANPVTEEATLITERVNHVTEGVTCILKGNKVVHKSAGSMYNVFWPHKHGSSLHRFQIKFWRNIGSLNFSMPQFVHLLHA